MSGLGLRYEQTHRQLPHAAQPRQTSASQRRPVGVLREVDELPNLLSSQSLFGNDHPLEVEIGSGKGLFMATASVANEGHNFLGVEIIAKYAAHCRIAKMHA